MTTQAQLDFGAVEAPLANTGAIKAPLTAETLPCAAKRPPEHLQAPRVRTQDATEALAARFEGWTKGVSQRVRQG